MCLIRTAVCILWLAATAHADAPVVVRLHDGSTFHGVILQESLEVTTSYGKLIVPMREVRQIDVGFRYAAGVEDKIRQAVLNIGSGNYKDRAEAEKTLLDFGAVAYPQVAAAKEKGEAEARMRLGKIAKVLETKHPEAKDLREGDSVRADFTILGRLADAPISFRCAFGDQKLNPWDIRQILVKGDREREWTVEAKDGWFDTGMKLSANQTVALSASGSVDLWPQGPGQYVTNPKGYTATGKNSAFMAGTLIGKVGDGKEFKVGEKLEGVQGEGVLFLQIVPSPWNNASDGSYRVIGKSEWK